MKRNFAEAALERVERVVRARENPQAYHLYHGSVQATTTKIVQDLGENRVNMAFFSPPYNAMKDKKGDSPHYTNYSDNLTDEEFMKVLLAPFKDPKLMDDRAPMFMNLDHIGSNRHDIVHLACSRIQADTDFKLVKIIMWNKRRANPRGQYKLTHRLEPIALFVRKNYTLTKEEKEWIEENEVVDVGIKEDADWRRLKVVKAHHTATFPYALPLHFIEFWCPPGGIVLDPFSGTGSTGHACMKNGNIYVGIDLCEKYIKGQARFFNVAIRS